MEFGWILGGNWAENHKWHYQSHNKQFTWTQCVQGILDAVASSGQTHEQRACALAKALNKKKLAPIVQAAGLVPDKEVQQMKQCQVNMGKMMERAREKAGPGGSLNHDKKSMVETLAVAVVNTPVNSPPHPDCTTRCPGEVTITILQGAFGMSHSAAAHLFKKAREKRAALVKRRDGTSWSRCKGLKPAKTFTKEFVLEMWNWVEGHTDVVQSPFVNDTLLIKNRLGVKTPVPELLLRIPIHELHNDMVKPVSEGGFDLAQNPEGEVTISDTSLHKHLPPQLCRMSERHKQMCGCEPCSQGRSLTQSLQAWRRQMVSEMKRQKLALRENCTRQGRKLLLKVSKQLDEYMAEI